LKKTVVKRVIGLPGDTVEVKINDNKDYEIYNRTKAVEDDAGTPADESKLASDPAGPTAVKTKNSPADLSKDEKQAIANDTWDKDTANPNTIEVNGKDDYEYLVLPADVATSTDVDWSKADKCPKDFTNSKKSYTKDSNGNPIQDNKDYTILVRKSETGTSMPSNPVTVPAYTTQTPPAEGEGYEEDYPNV
jgi:signal peptidase I